MIQLVLVLCALTSLAGGLLLFRGYLRTRTRLLLVSALCFLGLAANNTVRFVDVMVGPSLDLSLAANVPALLGVMLLIYGLIHDTDA